MERLKKSICNEQIYYRMLLLFLLIVVIYFVIGQKNLEPEMYVEKHEVSTFQKDWEVVYEDGTRERFDIPKSFTKMDDEGKQEAFDLMIENTVPENICDDACLMFWNAEHTLKVYVGDELRRTIPHENAGHWGAKQGVSENVWVQLYKEDIGKTIRICFEGSTRYNIKTAFIGYKISLVYQLVQKAIVEIMVALMIIVASIICIIVCYIFERTNKVEVTLKYYSYVALIAASWIIMNNTIRQYLFPNVGITRDCAYFLICLGCIPYAIYVDQVQKKRNHVGFVVAEITSSLTFLASFFLYHGMVCNFKKLQFLIHGNCVFVIVFSLITFIKEAKNKKIKEAKYSAISIGMLGITSIIQIIIHQSGIFESYNGMVIEIGLIFSMGSEVYLLINEAKKLSKDKAQAIYESKMKSEFLANMSHEIRTPINAVLGMDELIIREAEDSTILSYAQQIKSSGNTLLTLINDILDFSKIESGKMDIVDVEYDMESVIRNVVNMMLPRIEKKKLSLTLEIDSRIPKRLYGDDVRIGQIITNILSNAVKYTETGYVTLIIQLKEVKEEVARLFISVKDTGIGIKPEDQKKLFQSFQRVDQERNRNIEGTGLGLAITGRLLGMMNSHLEVNSVYGEGSEFFFEIEQKIIDRTEMGAFVMDRAKASLKKESYTPSFIAPNAEILVVDDNKVNLAVVKGLVKQTKCNITTAMSGKECIELLKKNTYQVVFLDHLMPEMDGIETLREIHKMKENHSPDAKFVMLTANAMNGAEEMYLREGFDAFLDKPVKGERLEEVICSMLPKEYIQKNPNA